MLVDGLLEGAHVLDGEADEVDPGHFRSTARPLEPGAELARLAEPRNEDQPRLVRKHQNDQRRVRSHLEHDSTKINKSTDSL